MAASRPGAIDGARAHARRSARDIATMLAQRSAVYGQQSHLIKPKRGGREGVGLPAGDLSYTLRLYRFEKNLRRIRTWSLDSGDLEKIGRFLCANCSN